MSQSVYLGRFLTKTCYTNNGQTTKVISHSYIICLHELYNFVIYCKYDCGFWGAWTGDQLILCVGGGRLWRNVLESLTVTYHSLTWKSRTSQFVCQYKTSHMLYFSPGIYEWCIIWVCYCVQRLTQLWVQQERGWVWIQHFTFGDIWVWKRSSIRRGEKKHAVFLLCHIVVLTVIFNMWWLFVKENEGLVGRSSHTQLTCLWLIRSAGCVDVCVSMSYGFIHIGFQCAMCCFLGVGWGWGWYLSCKCEVLIWLFYYYINIHVKVWMVKPFRKVAFPTGKGGVGGSY